jgi:hypothetical protein
MAVVMYCVESIGFLAGMAGNIPGISLALVGGACREPGFDGPAAN